MPTSTVRLIDEGDPWVEIGRGRLLGLEAVVKGGFGGRLKAAAAGGGGLMYGCGEMLMVDLGDV